MSYNPRSLANLRPGNVSPDPAIRRARGQKGGRARAAKALSETERRIQREYGPAGLAIFRQGYRAGWNRARTQEQAS